VWLDGYRAEAEAFLSAIDREYYLHFSGRKDTLEIEPIYERHEGLFSREAVERLQASDERELLRFAVEAHVDAASRRETVELAEREATLELELDGARIPFRQALVRQANEPDADVRATIEQSRLELIERELNPLLLTILERSRALCAELGWRSARRMCEDLSGIDLAALARETEAFLDATAAGYRRLLEPELRATLGFGLDIARRSDLPAFFRAARLDAAFPPERLIDSLDDTVAGLGVSGEGIVIDSEQRPSKSPRAFCAPVRAPGEVYLVIAPIGGREDFESLLHEAGHAYHFAGVDSSLPVEARRLGDNSVTECFAFLFQGLAASQAWLRDVLGAREHALVCAHARAAKLALVRRYCAKLAYELELHGDRLDAGDAARAYGRRLSDATGLEWPESTWLSDVDAYFYAARYLRAWALEAQLRRALTTRYGESWFTEADAGRLVASVWRHGQGPGAEERLSELAGDGFGLDALRDELVPER
jgi:hypothetical protein